MQIFQTCWARSFQFHDHFQKGKTNLFLPSWSQCCLKEKLDQKKDRQLWCKMPLSDAQKTSFMIGYEKTMEHSSVKMQTEDTGIRCAFNLCMARESKGL